jgi:cell division protein FtsL
LNRLNLLLLVALVMSCLYLVHTSYESRRLFAELERQRSQAQKLDQEAERLQVERRDQAKHLRVEKEASERLGMRPAGAGVTQFVRENAAGAAVAPLPAASGAPLVIDRAVPRRP